MNISNEIDQKLRRLFAGSTGVMTFHSRASVELELEGHAGRFKNDTIVSGSGPSVQYPRLPDGNPWSSDPVPPEPPLGWSVETQEPCGEAWEIEASAQLELARSSLVEPSSSLLDEASERLLPAADAAPLSSRGSGASFPRRKFT
jgi:hypothetical protein